MEAWSSERVTDRSAEAAEWLILLRQCSGVVDEYRVLTVIGSPTGQHVVPRERGGGDLGRKTQ